MPPTNPSRQAGALLQPGTSSLLLNPCSPLPTCLQMLYEGNEYEYEDFYDYSELEAQQASLALVTSPEELAGGGGYELALPGSSSGGGGKVGGPVRRRGRAGCRLRVWPWRR
jgi:hypothetical protein